MIRLFTGTPSSGKSFNAVKYILFNLRMRKPVIANFALKFTEKEKKRGYDKRFFYVPNNSFTIEMLILFALDQGYIDKKEENQCLVVFDEAGGKWNPKAEKKEITEWIDFFSQHAKIGFNIILISQSKAMLDRQVQKFIEYEHIHRKVNRYGMLVALPFTVFVSIEMWMQNSERISAEFYLYRKSISEHYDRYKMFEGFKISPALMAKIREKQGDLGEQSDVMTGDKILVNALRNNLKTKGVDLLPELETLDVPLSEVFVNDNVL